MGDRTRQRRTRQDQLSLRDETDESNKLTLCMDGRSRLFPVFELVFSGECKLLGNSQGLAKLRR